MYDYGWRNYAPDIARWITPDPLLQDLDFEFNPNEVDDEDDEDELEESTERTLAVGGGIFNPNNLNPYVYGYNDPVRFNDPDGKCPICVLALLAVLVSEPMKNGTGNPQADRQAFKQAEAFRNNQIAMVAGGAGGNAKNGASVILNVAKSKAQNEVRKTILQQNSQKGAEFEKTVVQNLKDKGHTNVQQQVTIKPNKTGAKNVRVDATSVKKGKINLTEAKSSSTAPLTKNQKAGFPIIQKSGGTVVGKGKPGIPGGTTVPPTKVKIVRPK